MTWATKQKSLSRTLTSAHAHSNPMVVGRDPVHASYDFTPAELFGAAARSSHLNSINIAVATPESEIMSRLIEQHVDDISPNFAIMATADHFKDYVGNYFTGTVAAGIAYLVMIQEGYVWSDHFENIGGGAPSVPSHPDYAFTGPSKGLALMEAKGSRKGKLTNFDRTVLKGYIKQVEPHLGHFVGGQTAVRGYSIGSWMQSNSSAQLRVHHTAPPFAGVASGPTSPAGALAPPAAATSVQRNNFATAFSLAHSPVLSNAIRSGDTSAFNVDFIPFLRFRWLDAYWVSSPLLPLRRWRDMLVYPETLRATAFWPWMDPFLRPHLFAVREDIAQTALSYFLNSAIDADRREIRFEVVGDDLRQRARGFESEGTGGAIFPDGLALVRSSRGIDDTELVAWFLGGDRFKPI